MSIKITSTQSSKQSPNKILPRERQRLLLEGLVQGVGFRPFVYRLSKSLGLSGYVQNTHAGVVIEIEGASDQIAIFKIRLMSEQPIHAKAMILESQQVNAQGAKGFEIRSSEQGARVEKKPPALMLPDLAVCPHCLHEMNDPLNRRYRYPFITCTKCGPRFSIMTALPYDRCNTTMTEFKMCPDCQLEYQTPENPRYHAQTIACIACGPQLQLFDVKAQPIEVMAQALKQAVQVILDGKILALKGIAGFHLLCDARNEQAVAELRRRKCRLLKPFAVMCPSIHVAHELCQISVLEEQLLTSVQAPIVLLRRHDGLSGPNTISDNIAENIAPGNANLGVFLPSTPLHYLLLQDCGFPLVATSGNKASEPVSIHEDEAVVQLKGIADFFLVHNRLIVNRSDDSIVRVMAGSVSLLRRARGYAPLPIQIQPALTEPVLAVGGHLKNTLALAVQDSVFLSPHIGDLDSAQASALHQETLDWLCDSQQVKPKYLAHDLHPDYRSTRMAQQVAGQLGVELVSVQHHYAHGLACMAENGLQPPCLAVTWDGSGYGVDGSLWGGEFLRFLPCDFERALHFLPFPLLGGEASARDPRRAALGMLYVLQGDTAFNSDLGFEQNELKLMHSALIKGINCPLTSSVGRIFDAVAALLGVCTHNGFEGQAAMALESAAAIKPVKDAAQVYQSSPYDFIIQDSIIDWRPMLQQILQDIKISTPATIIAKHFHTTLATMILATAKICGEKQVLLTGGCFQNALLLEETVNMLKQAGFSVFWHHQVPPNDGGLALGQVMAVASELGGF